MSSMELSLVQITKKIYKYDSLFEEKERKKSVYPKTNDQKGLALILNFTKGRPGT